MTRKEILERMNELANRKVQVVEVGQDGQQDTTFRWLTPEDEKEYNELREKLWLTI